MLIIARRKGQRIRIGAGIEVVVTAVSRGEVRLGIVAPPEVAVSREEVHAAVEAANRAAAESRLETPEVSAEVRVADIARFSSSFERPTRS
jgi:carbon storage regulator CsrA